MKLRNLPLLLAITAGLASTTAQAAITGNLNFTGVVNAGTCNLATGDENRTITLPTVKVSDFDNSNSPAGQEFELTANCESDLKFVYFLFAGTPSTGDGTLFANTGTSRGTALSLAHPGIAYIPANGTPAQRTRQISTSAGKAVLPLIAKYHTTGAAITAGTFASAVTVSITYN